LEQRLALIDHEIEQKYMTLSGYFEAYSNVMETFDYLGDILEKEARQVYPENEEDVVVYVKKECAEIWAEVTKTLQNRDQTKKPPFSQQ
jgi:hypothetical protein